MTRQMKRAPHISSTRPLENQPEVAFGTSVNEPGGRNSKEYCLSHRIHHLLLESNPLESALTSGERCLHQQLYNELLQEYLLGQGTNNFPSSTNYMKLPYGSHACWSKCRGGTLIPGKYQTRRTLASLEVTILPQMGNILHMVETPKAE